MTAPTEDALSDLRLEFTPELTAGETPQDPRWQRISDYIKSAPGWSGDAGVSSPRLLGSGDIADQFRGPEEHSLSLSYWTQLFPVRTVIEDPNPATTLGVQSTDAGDTGIAVTIETDDGDVLETIETDGSDGTTFVTGGETFDSIGFVELDPPASGEIRILVDDGGSPGDPLGGVPPGVTDLPDQTAQTPLGSLITHDYRRALPHISLLARREVTTGGALGGGFREFVYASGCRPTAGTLPGDPSEGEPIIEELDVAARRVRSYVVHQPDSSVAPVVRSTSPNDTTQTVTIESEDAEKTDTYPLNGTTDVTGQNGTEFTDIDAISIDGEHEGDIEVVDGNGDPILDKPLIGTNTDGVESDLGLPLLGSGQHASPIGSDPVQFLGTSTTFAGGALADSAPSDRIHALDLSVEVEVSREPIQGTRAQAIDVGPRTVEVEADVAGPYESAAQNARFFRGAEGEIRYELPNGTFVVRNAQITDADDIDREAGDANVITSVTFQGSGGDLPAIDATDL